MDIKIELPGVRLGLVEASDVEVHPASADLVAEMDRVCSSLRERLTVEQVVELPGVRAVRAMFRAWNMDPSKYRPSSEALLRRVVQGKGLYHISNVVDVINLDSIESAWPLGLYDLAHVNFPVAFRHGRASETYYGIGRRLWHLEGRPVLADAQGAFGSPISDSTRTMVTEAAHNILTVVFAPAGASTVELQSMAHRHAARLERFCSARTTRITLLP